MSARKSTAPAAAAAGSSFEPRLVHAYRRKPNLLPDPKTGQMMEVPVEVVFMGEKVKFASNEAGHIVGMVASKATYDRLVNEIPEAYIPYAGGDNLPAAPVLAAEHKVEQGKPAGQFVLESTGANGKPEFKVLDDLSDEEVRAFATEIGIEDEQLPSVLEGETLKRALFNLLQTA